MVVWLVQQFSLWLACGGKVSRLPALARHAREQAGTPTPDGVAGAILALQSLFLRTL